MAIAVITVVMTALTSFFISTMSSASQQRARQGAIQLSDTAMELVRGLGAAGAVAGHSPADVTNQWRTPLATSEPVKSWLTSMAPATDTTSVAPKALPTTPQSSTLNNVGYQVSYFVGWCLRPAVDTAASTDCAASNTSGYTPTRHYTQQVRVVVAVTWADKSCTASRCTYLTAMLLNGSGDLTFNFNATPPPAPTLTGCQDQASTVNDEVTRSILPAEGSPGCAVTGGVPTFTYVATGLPPGLTLNAVTGVVTGRATAPNPAGALVTVTVTDGFLKTATATFRWRVYPALVVTAPTGDRSSNVGQLVNVPSTATGGTGVTVWSASGLPLQLTINTATGAITGTATTAGSFPVTVRATNAATGATAQSGFTWTVNPGLAVTNPGTQTTSRLLTVAIQLDVQGGSGSYAFTQTGLPAGLTLGPDGEIAGVVAASNTTGPRNVTVTVTDTETTQTSAVTFSWNVTPAPSLLSPGNQTSQRNQVVNLQLGTCTSCTYTLSGALPPGLTLNPRTGVISGTTANTNGVYRGISISVVDAGGGRATTTPFQWNVTDLRLVVGDQNDRWREVNLPLAATGGRGPYTYTSTGSSLPGGLSIVGDRIVGDAPIPPIVRTYTGLVVTVTDQDGATVSSPAFRWVITW